MDPMVLLKANYDLVVDQENNPIKENNKILVYHKTDQQLVYIDEALASAIFPSISAASQAENSVPSPESPGPSSSVETVNSLSSSNSPTGINISVDIINNDEDNTATPNPKINTPNTTTPNLTKWQKHEIVALINLYSEHQNLFRSTTIKNCQVWKMIAAKIKTRSDEQCLNKFKCLKSKYVEKKDNIKNTGTKNIKFDYFDEMDELFRSDHNVTPPVTASSIAVPQNDDDGKPQEKDHENEDVTPKKRKKSVLEKQLENFNKLSADREEAKQKRHDEMLKRQDKAVEIFADISNTFKLAFVKK